MPPRETTQDDFYTQPPLQDVVDVNPLSSVVNNYNQDKVVDDIFSAAALDTALNGALEANENEKEKNIANAIALGSLVENMDPDKKKRFQKFLDNYVGDPNPENRKGVHAELPNTAYQTRYGEVFYYNLPCIAVLDPKTCKIIVVTKDSNNDSNRTNCWRVTLYDIFEEDPEKAISEQIVQNVITDPQHESDTITLDIVDANSPQFIDYHLYYSLNKADYSRDKKQPVTLMTSVPYGEKSIVHEYPIDVGELYEKLNEQKTIDTQERSSSIFEKLGHIAA